MNFKYNINGKPVNVFIWGDQRDEVFVYDTDEVKCLVNNDKDGKYFIYNNEKIYIEDFIKYSMDDIKSFIRNKKLTSDLLCQAILSEGSESLRFLMPDFYNKENHIVKIQEGFNREIRQNFKFTLIDVHTDRVIYDSCISVFVGFLNKGIAKVAE